MGCERIARQRTDGCRDLVQVWRVSMPTNDINWHLFKSPICFIVSFHACDQKKTMKYIFAYFCLINYWQLRQMGKKDVSAWIKLGAVFSSRQQAFLFQSNCLQRGGKGVTIPTKIGKCWESIQASAFVQGSIGCHGGWKESSLSASWTKRRKLRGKILLQNGLADLPLQILLHLLQLHHHKA